MNVFQVDYPEIAEGITPRHRFMSAYEQRIEPPDKAWQYLLFAAEPYETIAFKVITCFSLLMISLFNFTSCNLRSTLTHKIMLHDWSIIS